MDVSLFDFPLPPELIAQKPSQKRQESRLLVVSKEREEFVQARFCDLPSFLSPGDLLVVNNTRVEPVKLIGKRENGVSVEFLLVQPLGDGLFSTLSARVRAVSGRGRRSLSAEVTGERWRGGKTRNTG